jgi:hypothetical protein
MAILSYDLGDRVRLGNHTSNTSTGAITDVTGAAADPTDITLTTRAPDGTLTVYTYNGTPALLKETTGRYYVDVTLDAEGLWSYRLVGTGAVVIAEEGVLHVRRSVVAA